MTIKALSYHRVMSERMMDSVGVCRTSDQQFFYTVLLFALCETGLLLRMVPASAEEDSE